MKLRIGANIYTARLRYLHRTQTWVLAVGPVQISRDGLRHLDAEITPANDVESRHLADAGFDVLPAMAKAS